VEVHDNLFIPPIDVALINQTSCDVNNPNGQLTATIDETTIGGAAGVNTGYSFGWSDNGSGPVLVFPGTAVTTTTGVNGQVDRLPGNRYYTVEATRASTGCTNTQSVFLEEVIVYPIVVATNIDPVTRCDTPDGQMEANVSGTAIGYTFYWLNEVGQSQTTLNTDVVANADATISDNGLYPNLIPGYYTVAARDNFTTCLSQPVTREVVDATVLTNIAVTLGPGLPSTCGSFDGEMSATVTGGSGGTLDLFWHYGGPVNDSINFFNNPPQFTAPDDVPFNTLSGAAVPAVSNINSLESRLYTLVVHDNGNGCGNYETIFLPFQDAQEIAEVITPSTICPYTVGNGQVEVTLTSIPAFPAGLTFQDFSYSFYAGENPDPSRLINPPGTVGPGAGVSDPMVYSSLAPGKYTIEVRQGYGSFCPVYDVIEVESWALPPLVDLVGSLTANTACDINFADGGAEISIAQDPNDLTAGNTYTLGVLPLPGAGAYPVAGLGAGNVTIGGLRSKNDVPQYTITVTSSNNCVTERFIEIPNLPTVAELVDGNVMVVDAAFCLPALETSAQVEVTGINIVNGPADNMDDYRFDWYSDAGLTNNILSAVGDASAAKGGELLSNVGAPLPSSPVTVGTYWVVGTKVNAGATGGVGCFSAPFRVSINDDTVDPTFSLTPQANTACGLNYEGQVTVDAATASGPGSVPGATYSYAWVLPAGATVPIDGNGFAGVADLFTGLRDGLYTLNGTNELTGCQSASTASVIKLDIPVVITTVDHVDNEYCFPNGEMLVQEVIIDGIPEADHNLFNFEWFANTPTGVPAQQGLGLDAIGGLVNGSYYVIATVDNSAPIGSGCKSPPARADIKDIHVNPTINLASIANTACDNNFDGQITITSATASGPGAAANYDFNWLTVPAGNVVSDGIAVPSPYMVSNVSDGTFVVRASNNITQCFVDGTITLMKNPPPVEILTVNKTDQMICLPDGSILVTAVSPATVADYTFNWFKSSPNSIALQDAGSATITTDQLDAINYPDMGMGTYYVVGIKNPINAPGSGCRTPAFRVDINDLSVDPQMAFTFEPNSSCNPMIPNGVVLAMASERDGTTDNYGFMWTLNGAGLPVETTQTDTSPSSQLDNAFEGNYVLQVTNSITGCSFNQGLTVNVDRTISLPNIVQVNPINPTDCFPTGSAQVVEITIGGVTTITDAVALDADFDYEWYKAQYPANLLPGEQLTLLANQLPDRYFVLVEDLTTNCKSTPVEVVIEEADIVYPDVNIQLTVPQISCDPLAGTAILVAQADGQNDTNPDYSFTWFPSLDLSGVSFAGTSTITDLMSGDYSVSVFNAATNCVASALYIVPDNAPQFLPQLSLSTSGRTRCDIADGLLLASGVPFPVDPSQPLNNYPFAYNYSAELYDNDPPADINSPEYGFMNLDPNFPGFSNFLEADLAEGTYTVRMTDLNTGCVTIDHVDVADNRVYPLITIVEDNPMINCDPLRPNGQLSATADGGKVGGYQFEWYAGGAPSGTILSSNNKLIGQAVGSYTVLVTNNLTQCPNDETGMISDGTVLPPSPIAELIQGRTSCIVPNGWVAANVGGSTLGYAFAWYDGSTAQGSPDHNGVDYMNLDIGPYSVTATDIVTGCISLPTSIDVPDLRVIPEVTLTSTPSYCLYPSGSVNLALITPNVVLTDIQWFDQISGAQIGSGPASYDLPAGFYQALFVSSEGCENESAIEVGTEILSYNLVSVNGDNMNDSWIIDCIQNFPANNVKVFNRSGVKVYEADGYNNVDVIFYGIGERGVYAMGNSLPDGTYFYIIDKRDGSKPVTGYLELVR
jgi:hypothetical protein